MKFKSKYGPISVVELGKSKVTSADELIRGAYAYQHIVQITFNGMTAQFPFTSSISDYQKGKSKLSDEDLMYAVEYFLEDGIHAEDSFENFCDEFGYVMWADDPEDATKEGYDKKSFKIYRACEKSRTKAERLGINLDMAYDIIEELREAGYE